MNKTILQSVDDRFLDGLVFCGLVYEIFEKLRGDPEGVSDLRMRRGKCKKLVEELLPLCKYIQAKYRPGRYISVRWKDGNQGYDAELRLSGEYVFQGVNPVNLFVEVTCVVHPNDYLAREHLDGFGGVFGLDGLGRTKDHGVTTIPTVHVGDDFIHSYVELVLAELTKKAAKVYPEQTALVVQCSLNRLYLPDEWDQLVSNVRRKVTLHSFSEIFLYDPVCEYSVSI